MKKFYLFLVALMLGVAANAAMYLHYDDGADGWNNSIPQMAQDGSTYTYTLKNVTAKTVYFILSKSNSTNWDVFRKNNNFYYTGGADSDYKATSGARTQVWTYGGGSKVMSIAHSYAKANIEFKLETGTDNYMTVTVTEVVEQGGGDEPQTPEEPEVGKVYLLGDAFGGWDNNSNSYAMVETAAGSKIYEATYTQPAGGLFRIHTELGSWEESISVGPAQDKTVLEVPYTANVKTTKNNWSMPASYVGKELTFSLNLNTNVLTVSGDVPALTHEICYYLHGSWDSSTWESVQLTDADNDGIYTAEVKVTYSDANFGIMQTTDGAQTAWYSFDREVSVPANVNATYALSSTGSNNLKIAEGTYAFTWIPENKLLTVEATEEQGGEDPQTPEEPTVYFISGSFNEWPEGIAEGVPSASEEDLVDNCFTIVIPNYTNGEGKGAGFKVVAQSGSDLVWYGCNSEIVNNNPDWYTLSEDEGNIVLPASAEGQTVTVTVAVDNMHFVVSWDENQVVDPQPAEVHYVVRGNFDGEWKNYPLVVDEELEGWLCTEKIAVTLRDGGEFGVAMVDGEGNELAWIWTEEGKVVPALGQTGEMIMMGTSTEYPAEEGYGNLTAAYGNFMFFFTDAYVEEMGVYVLGYAGAAHPIYNITFDNGASGWDEVHAYVYDAEGNYIAEWPGEAMKEVDGEPTKYSYSYVYHRDDCKVIFNDGEGGLNSDKETEAADINDTEFAAGAPHEYPELIIVGYHNDWSLTEGYYPMTRNESNNTYSATNIALDREFLIVVPNTTDWNAVRKFGVAAAAQEAPRRAKADGLVIVEGGNNIPCPTSGKAGVVFNYDYKKSAAHTVDVAADYLTGIENVSINADGEAVYYNLQGVRVANPVKGQAVIAVRGGNITKEVIR